MAEEPITSQEAPAPPPPSAPAEPVPAPPQDAETQHALEGLARRGGKLKEAPKPAAEPAEARPAEESARPSADEARRRYQERAQRRAQEQAAERQRYEAALAENERLQAQRAQWEAMLREHFGSDEDGGLPPFEEDPQAWYQAAFDRALDQRLQPLLERMEAAETERYTFQQQRQQAELAERARLGFLSSVHAAEEEYAATAEGTGYRERFDRYIRAMAADLKAAGRADEDIVRAVFTHAQGLARMAFESGEQPAYYIDAMIRHHPFAQEKGGAAPAPAQPSLAPPARGPVQDLQKAAAAPGVAGSLSRGGVAEPSGTADIKAVVRSGKFRADDMRNIVNAGAGKGTSVRARVREAIRQAEALTSR